MSVKFNNNKTQCIEGNCGLSSVLCNYILKTVTSPHFRIFSTPVSKLDIEFPSKYKNNLLSLITQSSGRLKICNRNNQEYKVISHLS